MIENWLLDLTIWRSLVILVEEDRLGHKNRIGLGSRENKELLQSENRDISQGILLLRGGENCSGNWRD